MKTKSIIAVAVFCFASAILSLAQDAQLGSWKLNESKSTFSPGAPKTTSGMYAAAGDSVKVTLDGTSFDGKPTHNEWTGKYDGKDYPVTGDPNQSSRSYTMVNPHSMTFIVKSGDKPILTGTIDISADGKTRTVKANGMSAAGMKISYSAVYDKQ